MIWNWRKSESVRKILIRNLTRESILADNAELADTSASRRKGLLTREALYPGQGLWIVPCGAIHTIGMRFSIDVLYLDRKRRVKKIRAGVTPWRVSMCLLAHSVLELPTGSIARTRTQAGDQLEFQLSGLSGK
jgi:uncharacterized protein